MENRIREQVARVPAEDLEWEIEKVKARLKTLGRRGRVLRQNFEQKKALLASKKHTGEKLLDTVVALEEEEKSCQSDLSSHVENEKGLAENLHELNMEGLEDITQDCEVIAEIVAEGANDGERPAAYAVSEITEGVLGDGEQNIYQMADDIETTEGSATGIEGLLEKVEVDQKALEELSSGLVLLTVSPFEITLPDEHRGV